MIINISCRLFSVPDSDIFINSRVQLPVHHQCTDLFRSVVGILRDLFLCVCVSVVYESLW